MSVKHAADVVRQQSARDEAAARLEGCTTARRALVAPDASNFEASLAYEEHLAKLDMRVRVAQKALEVADDRLASARAAANEAEHDRAHVAAQKLAKEHERLTLDAVADIEALARKLAKLGEMLKFIEAANSTRGNRAFIVDGERKLRASPAQTIAEVFREETAFVDAQGASPMERRRRADGTWVTPEGTPLREVKIMVQQSPERFEPEHMPTRLAHAIQLVDLKGNALWPPR